MEETFAKQTETISENDKSAAAVSYIWIMSIFIFLAKRKNPFIRFHASQASALFFLTIIAWFIPVIREGLEFILAILMVLGFIKAAKGQYFKIPLIAQLVFTDNPIKTVFSKLGKSIQYFFLYVRVKASKDKDLKEKLSALKTELLSDKSSKYHIDEQDAKRNNDIAAFSYVWILSIIVYVLNEESDFVAFHARQGIVLFAFSVLFAIIPILGFYLNVLVLILSIVGFIMALSGSGYRIPVAAYIAEKNPSLEDFYLHIKASFLYIVHLFTRSVQTENKQHYNNVYDSTKLAYENKKEIYVQEEQETKDMAAASYLFLGPLMWLFHRKKPFVVFHARQATILIILFLLLFLLEPIRWLSMLIIGMMLLGFLRSSRSEYYFMPLAFDIVSSQVTLQDIGKAILKFCITIGKKIIRLFTNPKEKPPTSPPPSSPPEPKPTNAVPQ